jgi:hypothetical protein
MVQLATVVDDLDTRLTNSRTPTSHVIATNLALGAEHTISLAAGMVLRASGHLQLTSNNYYTRILEQLGKYALANRRSHRRSCSTQINK